MDPRSRIPGVDRLLEAAESEGLTGLYPRSRVAEALRYAVDRARARLGGGTPGPSPDEVAGSLETNQGPRDALAPRDDLDALGDPAHYLTVARDWLEADARPSLRPVINATGVVLHTNLGRAPLAEVAREAMARVTAGYANLEYDLDRGSRGSRYDHCARLLAELTGAEDGLVVNNCAGGLVLALNALARGRDVVVSRGEMVEIGGGFRVPEIMEQAGAGLREVGATNRTRAQDYEASIRAGGVAAILKVHRSNFRISGFTEEASLAQLSAVARETGLPLIHDLGSGLLMDPSRLGLPHEPTPAASIREGADLVIFSGDKLLGGPQAGLVVGGAEAIGRLRRSPLCRALRVDKATLAGLEATLRLYRDPERARREVPVLRMLSTSVDDLESRARSIVGALEGAGEDVPGGSVGACVGTAGGGVGHGPIDGSPTRLSVVRMNGRVGGGTFPEVEVPSAGIRMVPGDGDGAGLEARLRAGNPPVIGRVEESAVLVDLRTVQPAEDGVLAERIRSSLTA